MKFTSIPFILILLGTYSCVPKNDTEFNDYSPTSVKSVDSIKSQFNDDGSALKDPDVKDSTLDFDDVDYDDDDYKNTDIDLDDNYDDVDYDESTELVNCDFDLKITSASLSSTKIIIGNEDTIKENLLMLNTDESSFLLKGLNSELVYSSSDFIQTTHSDSLAMAFEKNSKYKVTSSAGDNYMFYSKGEFEFDTTSSLSERLVILAKNKLVVNTTSFDVKSALFLLQTSDKDIKVCIRSTGAGSVDLEIVGESDSIVNIVSKSTTFKDAKIISKVTRAGQASQYWKGTSFSATNLQIINNGINYNSTHLGFTGFRDNSQATIEQSGTLASATVNGTSLGADSEIVVKNHSENGTHLSTGVIHGTLLNKYRAYQGVVLGSGATEVLNAN